MEYAVLYPRVFEDDEVQEGIVVMARPAPCAFCGTVTVFFDQSLNQRVCSEECERELWERKPE